MADNDARLPDNAELDESVVHSVLPDLDDESVADGADLVGVDSDGHSDQVDLPGELLARASDEVDGYEIDQSEKEAEELTEPGDEALTINEAGEPVDDASQLAEAEAQARVASSTRPRKRKQRVAPASNELSATDKVTGPVTVRPKRKSAVTAELEDDDAKPGKASSVVAKKDHPTTKRRQAQAVATKETHKRVGPGQFIREVIAELRKVVWPTGPQLAQYFVVVLVFVLFIIAFVFGLDWLFGYLTLKIFG